MLEEPDRVQTTVAHNARRARFIERFANAERRRRPRRWFSFTEVADWCARERGGMLRDEDRRSAAYGALTSALLDGKFEKNARSMVLYLPPECPSADTYERTRLEAEWARELLNFYGVEFVYLVLAHCWLSRGVCHHWFVAQRIDPPGDWFAGDSACGTIDTHEATLPEPDARWADPDVSHEDWAAEVARRDATLPPPRRVPAAIRRAPQDTPTVSSARQRGWHQVKDYVDGSAAIEMIVRSGKWCTVRYALHHLLTALSDETAGIRAVIHGQRLPYGAEWRAFSVDEGRASFVGPGGTPAYRVAMMQITNMPLREWIGRNLWSATRDDAIAAAEPVQHRSPVQRLKTNRGRRPKYNWPPVHASLRAKLREDGCPRPGDGGQADLERRVTNQFPPDACPTESLIRDHVRSEIAAMRTELGIEAER
jgi:hypothetical protein